MGGFQDGFAQSGIISGRLVGICSTTYETVENFKILSDRHAVVEFRDTMQKDLIAKGWPIATDFFQEGVFPIGTLDHLMLMPGWLISPSRLHWRGKIQSTVDQLDDKLKPFFLNDKRVTELEESAAAATAQMKQKYGDPATVKRGTRSLRQAIFSAIAAKFTKETPETRLCREMKKAAGVIKSCRAKGVAPLEAGQRAKAALSAKGWPADGDGAAAMVKVFSALANAANRKTSVWTRYELQDENYPPRKEESAAREFLLAHPADFPAALGEAVEQLALEKSGAKKAPSPAS